MPDIPGADALLREVRALQEAVRPPETVYVVIKENDFPIYGHTIYGCFRTRDSAESCRVSRQRFDHVEIEEYTLHG